MKKTIIMAAMLLVMPCLAMADDGAWGDVGGGSFNEEKPAATEAPTTNASGKVCGQDDARMGNFIAVLKDVKAGKEVQPLELTFGTYMDLSEKVRNMLGDNIIIVTASCKKQFIMDGELTGKVEMPFPEVLTYISDALRARDSNKLKFIFANVKAAPDTLHNIMSYSIGKSYPLESGKVLASIANIQPSGQDKTSMAIVLLSLYESLGGHLAQGEDDTVYIVSLNGAQDFVVAFIFDKENYGITLGERGHRNGVTITEYLPAFLIGLYGGVGVKGISTDHQKYQPQ